MLSLYMIKRLTAVFTVGKAVAALGPMVATAWIPKRVLPLDPLFSSTLLSSVRLLVAEIGIWRSSVKGLKCWISAAALTIDA